jgi:hypothetical protein
MIVKKFTGAGICIIDNCASSPNFVLFRNVYNGNYYELGGTIDKNENIKITAIREALEESRGLINVNMETLNKLKWIDIKHNSTYYRCFILCVENEILSDDYFNNVKITNKLKLDKFWYETDNITKFSLNNIHNCFNEKQVCQDNDNKFKKISNRTINFIKEFSKHKYNMNISLAKWL